MRSLFEKSSGFVVLGVVQIIFLALFWWFGQYGESLQPSSEEYQDEQPKPKFAHFENIQVMIFIGFGFLMTFLRKYGYSATGYSLFLASMIVQWAILMKGFLRLNEAHRMEITVESIIDADIAAAVPLISMGALLGRTTPIQLLIMAIIEVTLFAVNEFVVLDIASVADCGGSITVHAFGAYFGLAVSLMLRPAKEENEAGKYEGANYTSDIFAMVGTLFLWVYWPSFNSVLADNGAEERAIVNTFLSLSSATVTTFILSAIVSHENKLDMVHVQNSTLAGGVAVGTVCNFMIGSHGAVLIGIIAGIVSVLGYRYLTPILTAKLGIHDTCGVHNLHGMPAVLSAIASAIYALWITKETYKNDLAIMFPAMQSRDEVLNAENNSTIHHKIMGDYGRTAQQQAGYQLFGIALTVAVAIVGGLLTGVFLKYTNIRKMKKDEHHQDELFWEVPHHKEE